MPLGSYESLLVALTCLKAIELMRYIFSLCVRERKSNEGWELLSFKSNLSLIQSKIAPKIVINALGLLFICE